MPNNEFTKATTEEPMKDAFAAYAEMKKQFEPNNEDKIWMDKVGLNITSRYAK